MDTKERNAVELPAPLYLIENPEVLSRVQERRDFFLSACQIDIADYALVTSDGVRLDLSQFERELLSRVFSKYNQISPGIFGKDFDVEKYVSSLWSDDSDIAEVSLFTFDRDQVNSIIAARGQEIKTYVKELQQASDGIVAAEGRSDAEVIVTGALASAGIVAFSVEALKIGYLAYRLLAPGAPAAFYGNIFRAVVKVALMEPAVFAGVVAAATIAGAILAALAFIDRKLVCLVINDTDYDLVFKEYYMAYGKLDAICKRDASAGIRVIPGRTSANTVYGSFFAISKSGLLYGAETTMRLGLFTDPGQYDLLVMTGNAFTESTRVNMKWALSKDWSHPEGLDLATVHKELYDTGSLDVDISKPGIFSSLHVNDASGPEAFAALVLRTEPEYVIDLSESVNDRFGALVMSGSVGFDYDPLRECYVLSNSKQAFFCLSGVRCSEGRFVLRCRPQGVGGKLRILVPTESDDGQGSVEVRLADHLVYEFELPESDQLYNCSVVCPASAKDRCFGDLIQVENVGKCPVEFASAAVRPVGVDSIDRSEWMSKFADCTPLCDMNIPGSHDACAINSVVHTPWACHRHSLTEQLNFGIRAFDVRIKVKHLADDSFDFVTCHGPIGSTAGLNEFQSLKSAFDEFEDFLSQHWSEALIVTLKVDDWTDVSGAERTKALESLHKLLSRYKDIRPHQTSLGSLGNARGKIVCFNRITESADFGYALSWTDNTDGSFALDGSQEAGNTRDFKVWVQDHFQFGTSVLSAHADKAQLVEKTSEVSSSGDGTVVFNYASACYLGALGVYCQGYLIDWLGSKEPQNRPKKLGWVFMDYEDDTYHTSEYSLVDFTALVIDSNSGYQSFPDKFKQRFYCDEL